jgi:hypothetical protein
MQACSWRLRHVELILSKQDNSIHWVEEQHWRNLVVRSDEQRKLNHNSLVVESELEFDEKALWQWRLMQKVDVKTKKIDEEQWVSMSIKIQNQRILMKVKYKIEESMKADEKFEESWWR